MEVIGAVTDANLRGRGGAGFPAGRKWISVPRDMKPCYLIANADEMEPGAFKDRVLMEGDPHQLIEGMLIAAYALEAQHGYIFLRAEYGCAAQRLQRAIDEARAAGYLGSNILRSGFSFDLRLHQSAGRYICGESTALINALEGRRAIPRAKPPRPTTAGLWGRPTIVNNVETLCNVPHIVQHGAPWFLDLSIAQTGKRGKDGGTKVYGVSGRVKRPGWFELPMGTPLRAIVEEHGGGMREGYRLRAVQPGGGSTGFLGAEHLDVSMDFDSPEQKGARFGTGTVMVYDHTVCPVGALLNLEKFFAQESCGWCTPCREGLPWVAQILNEIEQGRGDASHLKLLHEHTRLLGMGKTFCAHAPGAMEPLKTGLALFAEDFERHLREGRCPYLSR
jgi:NADH-quinone oxidoreductase subunit F